MFPAIFLILLVLRFFFPQTWLTNTIFSNFYYLGPYLFFPLFAIIGIIFIIGLIDGIKFSAIMDKAPIHVINLTDSTLDIYIRGTDIGEMLPGGEIDNKKVLSRYDNYLIEAKDESGKIFYSKDFSLDELDRTEWNIKIEHLLT